MLLSSAAELDDAVGSACSRIEVVESAELQAILGPLPPKAEDAIPAEIPPI